MVASSTEKAPTKRLARAKEHSRQGTPISTTHRPSTRHHRRRSPRAKSNNTNCALREVDIKALKLCYENSDDETEPEPQAHVLACPSMSWQIGTPAAGPCANPVH